MPEQPEPQGTPEGSVFPICGSRFPTDEHLLHQKYGIRIAELTRQLADRDRQIERMRKLLEACLPIVYANGSFAVHDAINAALQQIAARRQEPKEGRG